MEQQTETRNYFLETITFSLAKKDLFFIGQTLSTKYVNSDIAPLGSHNDEERSKVR